MPVTELKYSSGTWICPANVFEVIVECIGAGGNAGAPNNNVQAGGGGGGAYSKKTISVTPSNEYSFVVGISSEYFQRSTIFIDTSTVCAIGGESALGGSSRAGAAGGLASSGAGDVRYSGGNGAHGIENVSSGGGGGAGGETGDGGAASNNTAGTGNGTNSGNGGAGKIFSGPGNNGENYGGGAGGAWRSGGGQSATSGANGLIILTYTALAGTDHTQSLSDSIALSDENTRERGIVKELSDSVALADDTAKISSIQKEINDSVTLSENDDKTAQFMRDVEDSVSLSDLVNASFFIPLELQDSVSLSDEQQKGVAKSIADAVVISDNQTREISFDRELNDAVTLSENSEAETELFRALDDSVALSDQAAASLSFELTIADNVILSESTNVFWSNSLVGRISVLATRIGSEIKSVWLALSGKSDAAHLHTGVYDPAGAANTAVSSHETNHDHSTLHNPGSDAETANSIGALVSGATAKTSLVDADNVPITDSAAGHVLKKVTWANIKATLKTYFDAVYSTFSGSYNDLDDVPLTFTPSSHEHDGTYEPVFLKNTGFNKHLGTTAGTVAEGNDTRLSDARIPVDDSAGYTKIGNDLKTSSAIAASAIDWSASGVFTKTLTANTTFTFSNVQLNKVIALVLSGNFTLTMPSGVKVVSGEYDGSTTNYIQLHCTDATTPVVWCVVSQQAI